jgi:predicted RecB family endonuclease
MMNDMNNVTPVIKDGELYTGEKKKKELPAEPPKSGKGGNILLSLLAIAVIIYGVNSMLNKDNTKEEEAPKSNIVEEKKDDTETKTIETVDVLKSYVILSVDNSYNIFTSEDNSKLLTGLNQFSNNYILAISSLKCNHFDKSGTIDGEEMDKQVSNIFGNVEYKKEPFTIGNKKYTYNQELNKFYILSSEGAVNYLKYNYVNVREEENKVYIDEYVVYTNATSSVTLANTKLPNKIDGTNINTNYKSLKYYEYEFTKNNDDYVLTSITIK